MSIGMDGDVTYDSRVIDRGVTAVESERAPSGDPGQIGGYVPRIEPIPLDQMAPGAAPHHEEGVEEGLYATPIPLQIFAYKTQQFMGAARHVMGKGSLSEAGSSSCCGSGAPSWVNASPACSRGSTTPSRTRTWPA